MLRLDQSGPATETSPTDIRSTNNHHGIFVMAHEQGLSGSIAAARGLGVCTKGSLCLGRDFLWPLRFLPHAHDISVSSSAIVCNAFCWHGRLQGLLVHGKSWLRWSKGARWCEDWLACAYVVGGGGGSRSALCLDLAVAVVFLALYSMSATRGSAWAAGRGKPAWHCGPACALLSLVVDGDVNHIRDISPIGSGGIRVTLWCKVEGHGPGSVVQHRRRYHTANR